MEEKLREAIQSVGSLFAHHDAPQGPQGAAPDDTAALNDAAALNREEPRFMPRELLLTLVDPRRPLNEYDPAVQRLVALADKYGGIGGMWVKGTRDGAQADGADEDRDDDERQVQDVPSLQSRDPDESGVSPVQSRDSRDDGDDDFDDDGQLDAAQGDGGKAGAGPPPPLTLRLPVPAASAMGAKDAVKNAIDGINGNLDKLRDPSGVAVSSAAPNWIASSSRPEMIGGPGTFPDPAPDGLSYNFNLPPGAQAPDPVPANLKVAVVVLDTSPGRAALHAAAQRWAGNGLLRDLDNAGLITNWNGPDASQDEGVPHIASAGSIDHGLFVAGIVRAIAPWVEIRLRPVLDTAGLGHTQALLPALADCLSLARGGYRVVVNMSLYQLLPPGDSLWEYWFGGRPNQLSEAAKAALLEPLNEPLEQMMTLLLDAGVLIVSAAGNDGLSYSSRPQPRYPADFDNVFCVVATDRDGVTARYSNGADVPATGNCIATWGGQGVPDPAAKGTPSEHVAVVPAGLDPRDGVISVFTRDPIETLPGQTSPNQAGMAYWSGTSFATPIISAVAANLLARDRALTPRGIMAAMLRLARRSPDPALGCLYLPVTQGRPAASAAGEQAATIAPAMP